MTEPPRDLSAGRSFGNYEIVGLLGRGGMGEVYRARDAKLGREVALKVLPRELSGDPERAARFDREARMLASLQHPNVASIYGFEEQHGQRFLVMELVEGEDLARRMSAGALAIEDVTDIARQIAAGLEAAHEKGIVHRDLKPANVMITRQNEVKILDFGLARAWFGDSGDETDIGASPTITAAMTAAGTILGTAAYMSPEQARGRSVDRRADIWAFGVILFEMLTGKRLFEGETVSDTLAAVLRAEPDWDALPAEQAPLLTRIVERCLVRDPRHRLRDIGEVRILLSAGDGAGASLFGVPTVQAGPPSHAARRTQFAILAGCVVIALAAGAWVGGALFGRAPESNVVHAMIATAPETFLEFSSSAPGTPVLSPDGTKLAFGARDASGVLRLYYRRLDSSEPVMLSGTENAVYPFWSPDGEWIGFFDSGSAGSNDKLRKVAVGGGPPTTLCAATNAKGGTWNKDGIILFAPSHASPIHRVSAIGGEPEPVTTLADGEDSHRHPRFLPNGRDFVYVARRGTNVDEGQVFVASLDGGEPKLLTTTQSPAEFSQGHLLTVREFVLMATPFDPSSLAFTGGAIPLVQDLMVLRSGSLVGVYSASLSGALVYQTGVGEQARKLEWIELESGERSDLRTTGQLYFPQLSPDGSTAVVEVEGESQEGIDLWLVDTATGLRTRFTFDPDDESSPVFSPDGSAIYYVARANARSRLLRRSLDGTGEPEELFQVDGYLRVTSIDSTGTRLLLALEDLAGTKGEILVLPLDDPGEPAPIAGSSTRRSGAVFSPDGRWIAYYGDSTAGFDVFVVAADGGARKWQVSTDSGLYPIWSPNGDRIYAVDWDGQLKVYEVDGSGSSFRVGSSRVIAAVRPPARDGNSIALHPDGRRVLHSTLIESSERSRSAIHFVTDWRRGLMR